MMTDAPRVRAEDTLDTAVNLMEDHGHLSIVMVGPRGRARGVIRPRTREKRTVLVGENVETLPASSTSRMTCVPQCR